MASLKNLAKPAKLKIYMSNRYAYAQIIRLTDGNIVAAASTIEKSIKDDIKQNQTSLVDKNACSTVGKILAERANANGIDAVHWPRDPGQKYHGRIASLITSMQQHGLKLI